MKKSARLQAYKECAKDALVILGALLIVLWCKVSGI